MFRGGRVSLSTPKKVQNFRQHLFLFDSLGAELASPLFRSIPLSPWHVREVLGTHGSATTFQGRRHDPVSSPLGYLS